jgi:hypothetical protein
MRNKEVDAYINKQKSPQKEICKKLRNIILKTFPKIREEMWVGVPWYEGKYYIVGLKDHVNLGFSVKKMKKRDMDKLEGGGKTMRHMKYFKASDVKEAEVKKLLKMVVACGSCYGKGKR